MIGREIASMSIENDRVVILETRPADTVIVRKEFLGKHLGGDFAAKSECIAEWYAVIDEEPIAYAALHESGGQSVVFSVYTPDEYRGLGLGKLMIRCATDLAIVHRQRLITTMVPKTQESAIHILEEDGFDRVPSPSADSVTMVKQLRWEEPKPSEPIEEILED